MGVISRAVAAALRSAPTEGQDAGTVALAKRYAALIDDAAATAKYRKYLGGLRAALADADDETVEHLERVAEALAAHSVASDLGPKLLATLTALGMTPTARGAKTGGQNGAPVGTALDELRARRATRAARAR